SSATLRSPACERATGGKPTNVRSRVPRTGELLLTSRTNEPRLRIAFLVGLTACVVAAMVHTAVMTPLAASGSQAAQPPARPPPTRDPHTPGYVPAKELPDGAVPPPDVNGSFIVGPTHNPAPEMTVQQGVPQGRVSTFTMPSADSTIYPGIARDAGTFGTVD